MWGGRGGFKDTVKLLLVQVIDKISSIYQITTFFVYTPNRFLYDNTLSEIQRCFKETYTLFFLQKVGQNKNRISCLLHGQGYLKKSLIRFKMLKIILDNAHPC